MCTPHPQRGGRSGLILAILALSLDRGSAKGHRIELHHDEASRTIRTRIPVSESSPVNAEDKGGPLHKNQQRIARNLKSTQVKTMYLQKKTRSSSSEAKKKKGLSDSAAKQKKGLSASEESGKRTGKRGSSTDTTHGTALNNTYDDDAVGEPSVVTPKPPTSTLISTATTATTTTTVAAPKPPTSSLISTATTTTTTTTMTTTVAAPPPLPTPAEAVSSSAPTIIVPAPSSIPTRTPVVVSSVTNIPTTNIELTVPTESATVFTIAPSSIRLTETDIPTTDIHLTVPTDHTLLPSPLSSDGFKIVNSFWTDITGDDFGMSLSLDHAGDIAAVGAPNLDASKTGGVYRINASEKLPSLILNSDRDNIGHKVTISDDGVFIVALGDNTVKVFQREVAGTFREKDFGIEFPGAGAGDIAVSDSFFAYTNLNEGKTVVRFLESNTSPAGIDDIPETGVSLDLSDGYVAIGSPGVSGFGKVSVYALTAQGWKLRNAVFGISPSFGFNIALTDYGKLLVVAAPSGQIDKGQGSVQVFRFDEEKSGYVSQGTLTEDDSVGRFAETMSLSEDGTRLAIGSPSDLIGNSRVHVYSLPLVVGDSLKTVSEEIASPGQTSFFGRSVAVSGDGSKILVGSLQGDIGYAILYEA